MKLFIIMASILTAIELPDKASINGEILYPEPAITVLARQTVLDSSHSGYTLWTQMRECLSYTQNLDAILEANIGFPVIRQLNVHSTPGDISFWIHDDSILGSQARYPYALAGYDPYTSFCYLIGLDWGGMGVVWCRGGWFSSQWDSVFYGPDLDVYNCFVKQLPDSNLILIGITTYEQIVYMTLTYDLSMVLSQGTIGVGSYWGFDINGGIAYVFYYDDSLNMYYRTTTDGINWSGPQNYNMVWPMPYTNNSIFWTQMAVTDAGDPLLVFDNVDGDDATYPYYSKVYVSYASGQPCVEVSSTFSAPDSECFYPTIATGGNMAAVLYCMPRNNEPDSLNWWDIYVVWSTDNGVTWGTPQNYTQSLTRRPGLPQLAKRIDTLRERVYYVYAVDIVENHDPLWHCWFDPQGLDPMYICFDYANYVGIEETLNPQFAIRNPKLLTVYPNPFSNHLVIQYAIGTKHYAEKNKQEHTTYSLLPNIRIYDAGGRLVKDFSHAMPEALHPTQIIWHGDDDFGRKLPAGVYFVRFESADYKKTEKAILLR